MQDYSCTFKFARVVLQTARLLSSSAYRASMQSASDSIQSNNNSVKKVKTRQRLIDAGLDLFSTIGVEGVSVSDLEKAVGLKAGTGSFYRHFPDKDTLLEAVIEQEIEDARARRAKELEAIGSDAEDLRDALRHQFKLTLTGLRRNQKSWNLFIRLREYSPELFNHMRTEIVEKAHMTILEHYSKRIAAEEIVTSDPIMLPILVQSALFGFHQAMQTYTEIPDDEFENRFVEALLELIIPEQP